MLMHRFVGFTLACLAFSLVAPIVAATTPEAAEVTQAKAVQESRLAELEGETGDRPVDSILEQALAYDERGQTTRAVELYQQVAAQGVGVAELRLGWFNESGTAGEQSYTLARGHYQKAAALGVPEANMRLGLMNLEGWGAPRDVQAAVSMIRLSADAGYQPAQQILSEMYFSGTGVAADLKQALSWAEKAASKQAPEAQTLAGAIRQKAARLPDDIRAAREWYQLSAEQEYTAGMRAMGMTFVKPDANPEEIALGIRWLELASENTDPMADFYLAGIYLWCPQYRDEPGSEEKAKRHLELSSAGGIPAATEVLELTNEVRTLAECFRYVTTVAKTERYVQRLAIKEPTESEKAENLIQPRLLKTVWPIYPAALLLSKIDGSALVEFVVDSTGRVRDAKIVSCTHQAFADRALASVVAWRFLPGYKNGRPINTRVRVPVEFSPNY